ncbi:hypothetical protein HED36_10585 [Staphylococcus hominis]|uniref:hypothetical protein n=1 Tax=Staphylococcus TaxID=1279 RepID=UPI0011A8FD54|nr:MULTISPECIES: hypothetical protein [Staphylococcus]MBF9286732.1 hypothetical protein [Staphylococcus epidermidis]NKD53921.1 hypothetical protein [Staphylococcus hominis]
MPEKSNLENSLAFNYFLLLVGVLTFLGYYFLTNTNVMIGWLMAMCPITVGITNIIRIKNEK